MEGRQTIAYRYFFAWCSNACDHSWFSGPNSPKARRGGPLPRGPTNRGWGGGAPPSRPRTSRYDGRSKGPPFPFAGQDSRLKGPSRVRNSLVYGSTFSYAPRVPSPTSSHETVWLARRRGRSDACSAQNTSRPGEASTSGELRVRQGCRPGIGRALIRAGTAPVQPGKTRGRAQPTLTLDISFGGPPHDLPPPLPLVNAREGSCPEIGVRIDTVAGGVGADGQRRRFVFPFWKAPAVPREGCFRVDDGRSASNHVMPGSLRSVVLIRISARLGERWRPRLLGRRGTSSVRKKGGEGYPGLSAKGQAVRERRRTSTSSRTVRRLEELVFLFVEPRYVLRWVASYGSTTFGRRCRGSAVVRSLFSGTSPVSSKVEDRPIRGEDDRRGFSR